jgi:hypothetical protein
MLKATFWARWLEIDGIKSGIEVRKRPHPILWSGPGGLREGMKQFDFNHPDFFRHQPRRRELFKKLYKSGATEDEYVKANQEIVKPNGRVYSRSRLRHEYRRLQRIYDFFSSP